MINPTVLVADGDTKNLQILKENLEASGFAVITASNGNKAWEEIQQSPPQLVLTEVNLPGLTGFQLLERLQADPNTKSIPLIFLTNQRDIQQRVRGFELGAKDYLVKPLHVKEVVAHIRMVLRRLERRKSEQLDAYMRFSGRLDQLTLADLIESFGVERKTGVLTLSNGRRTGQVYFREGAVVNASLGDIKQEPAIYQMLTWNRGYFTMVFKEIDVPDEISVSNLGLLLHGIKRLELREQLISQLSSPRTAFTITPTFRMLIQKRRVNGEIANFVKLFDGKREVDQIIEDSGLDDLVALKRIVRLYQQGFIKPTIPPETKPLPRQQSELTSQRLEAMDVEESSSAEGETVEPELVDKIELESQPIPKFKEIEREIRPILERIEQKKRAEIVPKPESEAAEVGPVAPDERAAPIEPEQKETHEFVPPSKSEKDEAAEVSQETFVDEELIQQYSISAREDRPTAMRDLESRAEAELPIEPPGKTVERKDEEEPRVIASLTDRSPVADRPPIAEQYEKKFATSAEQAGLKNHIVVISVDDDCKDEVMDILTQDHFTSTKIQALKDMQLDLGRIRIDGFTSYQLIAVSVDKPFHVFLESMKSKIAGFIFAVDCTKPETWEYSSYLIHSLAARYQLPYAVAVMNFLDQNNVTMDVIRYQFKLDEIVPLIAWDEVDKSSIRKILTAATRSASENMMRKAAIKDIRLKTAMM